MNKEKQIMDEFEIYESLIRKNANQKYIDCQMDRVIETIKKAQRKEIVEEIEVEDVKLIQIAPVEFNSIACGRQTNLYGLDDKGRIWVKHYNHWDKWVLSEKDIFIKEEIITKEDE